MPESTPQNIVYIMLDDADFLDFGFNNHLISNGDALTPNIDALRLGGQDFTQFYSASSICTPTRISVLTGDTPVQYGAADVWAQVDRLVQGSPGLSGLPQGEAVLGQIMQDSGRATGHFGKWHVGLSQEMYGHEALGFDEFSYHNLIPGLTDPEKWDNIYEFVSEQGAQQVDVDYIDEYFTDEVIDFIDRSAAANENFYLNFWPLTPHYPWTPPGDFDNSQTGFDLDTDRGRVLAMMYTIDQQIGRIVDTLQVQGILDETLIVITSDNGGAGLVQNEEGYLRAGKGSFFEGGIRVPMIAHWPDGITAGSSNETVMTTADLLPTFFELIGGDLSTLSQNIVGESKADAFDSNTVIPHDPILWELNGTPTQTDDLRAQRSYAYRIDDYKIIKVQDRNDLTNDFAYFLYDVRNDPQELSNLRNSDIFLLESLKDAMLDARITLSRYEEFPDQATTGVTVPFDPRLDVVSRDMTLLLTVIVPETIGSEKNIYSRDGVLSLSLQTDGTLLWTVEGATSPSQLTSGQIVSQPLAPGTHTIALAILGLPRDEAVFDLYVDGQLAGRMDDGSGKSGIKTVLGSTVDATLGDDGLTISDVGYYNTRFWADEIERARELDGSEGLSRLFSGDGSSNTITGTQDGDLIDGKGGDDTIDAGSGDDIVSGGAGGDVLEGGSGTDTLSYIESNAAVYVNFQSWTTSGGHGQGDSISGFENLVGSPFDDHLIGSTGSNFIEALAGNDFVNASLGDDTLLGGEGDDTLLGSGGSDTVNGGSGSDTASYFNSTGAVQIDLGAGTAAGFHASGDMLVDIENLLGSAFNDRLTGDASANTLTGGEGLDTLEGGEGDDRLEGQQGNDELIGGAGADFLSGGAGIDGVFYSASQAGVTVRIGGISTGGDAQGDILLGVENVHGSTFDDLLIGSNVSNRLVGNNGNDTLFGATNADTLIGGFGADMLIGGSGADILDGGADADTASYFSSTNGVHVNLDAGTAALGDATGDTLISIENLVGSNGGNDILTGDGGANILRGFAGADRLLGNGGNDILSLGLADGVQDLAIYGAGGFGVDTVSQFENGTDILDVRGLGISFADVNAVASGGGTNTTITFTGVSGQITLNNFAVGDLDSLDFFF